MKNWTGYSICSILCHSIGAELNLGITSIKVIWILCYLITFLGSGYDILYAQRDINSTILSDTEYESAPSQRFDTNTLSEEHEQDLVISRDTVPLPKSVMFRSMIVPGWGQITNRQVWKVPVIYGMLAGVVAYTVYSNDRYQGYKAAYYNSVPGNTDQMFGPTPAFIPNGQPSELYRSNRNTFRNRRDLSMVSIFLVYGLNIADAYIFAHLRDFDVSDDLSASIHPTLHKIDGRQTASLTFIISF